MKKQLLNLVALGLFASTTIAQQMGDYEVIREAHIKNKNMDTVAWIHNGTLSLGINQGLLHNWPAGGELASMTLNGVFSGSLVRYNNRHLWTNNLDAAYGLFYAYSNTFVPRKTDDRIDLTSKYGYRLKKEGGDLYFATLMNVKSQFTKGYDYELASWDKYPTSGFLAPLYITVAPGIEYRKGSQFSLFFSPIAARGTYVNSKYTLSNPEGAFGIRNGETFRMELGAYLTSRFEKNITENIAYRTRLDLYSNYLAKDIKDANGNVIKEDHPGNIDILWDNFISFKFFKYFALNIGVTAVYDNDIPYNTNFTDDKGVVHPKNEPFAALGWWQIKQFMNIGFNYKF